MEDIAIVGMGCLFPGYVTKEDFWEKMLRGESFTKQQVYQNKTVERGVMSRQESDAFFKKHLPDDFEALDAYGDLFKWLTYLCRETLADNDYLDQPEILQRTGLSLGIFGLPAYENAAFFNKKWDEYLTIEVDGLDLPEAPDVEKLFAKQYRVEGLQTDTEPTHFVMEKFGLGGPSINSNAACSSLPYAMKIAIMHLQRGTADMMLAGAQCYNQMDAAMTALFDVLGVLPNAGDNIPLDRTSKGVVPGSGAGMFLLKRLSDAKRDGDEILGVIESIGWSNDGGKKAILAPDEYGQSLAYEDAYKEDVSPEIDYIECHATGTEAGDIVEMRSITNFFREKGIQPMLGALKGSTGHFFTASSCAALAKVLLSMKHGQIPQTIHVKHAIDPQVVTQNTPWKQNGEVKRAAVNSFGFGGCNAHIVVREYDEAYEQKRAPQALPQKTAQPPKEVAVVGMGMHIGAIDSVDAYYRNLLNNQPLMKKAKKARWDEDIEKELPLLEISELPKGAYIDAFDLDYMEYKFPLKNDEYFLRKDFLLLKAAKEALLKAGVTPQSHPNTAVLINTALDYSEMNFSSSIELGEMIRETFPDLVNEQSQQILNFLREAELSRETPNSVPGLMPNIRVSRIAAQWGFHGPAFGLVNQAIGLEKILEIAQYLLTEEIVEQVVVGCVELLGEKEQLIAQKLLGNLDLMCEYGVSEGAVVFVLRKLETALAQNDVVYSVITDTELSPPKPDRKAQLTNSITQLLARHATEKSVGIVEMPLIQHKKEQVYLKEALAELTEYLDETQFSVQHIEEEVGFSGSLASAMALVKHSLQLFNGMKKESTATEADLWISDVPKHTVLLNNLDTHGYAAHVLLTDSKQTAIPTQKMHSKKICFPLAADTLAALQEALLALEIDSKKGMKTLFEQTSQQFLTQTGRYRLCLLAENKVALQEEIQLMKQQWQHFATKDFVYESKRGSYFTANPLEENAEIVYMFPPGEMFQSERFFDCLNKFPDLKQPYMDFTYGKIFDVPMIRDFGMASYLSESLQASLAVQLVRDKMGLTPERIAAVSQGEISALFALESVAFDAQYTLEELFTGLFKMMKQVALVDPVREGLVSETTKQWTSWYLVGENKDLARLVDKEPDAFITIVGSPTDCLIAGDEEACQRIMQEFQGIGVPIEANTIFHTPLVEQVYEKAEASAFSDQLYLKEGLSYTVYNSHTLASLVPMKKGELTKMFYQSLTRQVNYCEVIKKSYADGGRVFIDISTSHICSTWAENTLGNAKKLIVPIFADKYAIEDHFLRILAKLVAYQVPFDYEHYLAMFDFEVSDRPSLIRRVPMANQNRLSEILQAVLDEQAATPAVETTEPPVEVNVARQAPTTATKMDEQSHVTVATLEKSEPSSENPEAAAFFQRLIDSNAKAHQQYMQSEQQLLQQLVQEAARTQLAIAPQPSANSFAVRKPCLWDFDEIIAMNRYSFSSVLGEKYKEVDTYPIRARLPLPPFLFVHRITKIDAEFGVYRPSEIEIEFDITEDCILVSGEYVSNIIFTESAQIGIFLVAYIGIDITSKGALRFRIVNSNCRTFEPMPKVGATFRGVYRIKSFMRSGKTTMVTATYDVYVGDKLLMTLDSIGGFFTEQDLKSTKGIIDSELMKQKRLELKNHDRPNIDWQNTTQSYAQEDMNDFYQGKYLKFLPKALVAAHTSEEISHNFFTFKEMLINRVTTIQPDGGLYGLGEIIAERDIAPDYWAFDVHFLNDPVYPGSLLLEGLNHLAFLFLLHTGKILHSKTHQFLPNKDKFIKSAFRGQIRPVKSVITYKMNFREFITEDNRFTFTYDADIFWQGKNVCRVENLTISLE